MKTEFKTSDSGEQTSDFHQNIPPPNVPESFPGCKGNVGNSTNLRAISVGYVQASYRPNRTGRVEEHRLGAESLRCRNDTMR
jgi:hypothetical protein